MAKKSKGKRQDQQQVSAVLMEQRRLTLKAEMERWYRLRLEQFLSPDDARMAAYRTAGLATDLGTARRGKGTIGDWLAAHADRVIGGWRMITYPSIEVRTAALPHLREALDDELALVAAIVRLHHQAPILCMILLLVCFDSPWSEGDVARAFNDGSARSGWTKTNVTARKLKACLWIRAWTAPAVATREGPVAPMAAIVAAGTLVGVVATVAALTTKTGQGGEATGAAAR